MKYLKPNSLRRNLFDSIDQISLNKTSYVKNPTDHSRTRKLPFEAIINSILQMSGGSISRKNITNFRTWEQIAVDMGYNVRHLYRMHDKALKAVIVPK